MVNAESCLIGTRDVRPKFPLPVHILPPVERLYTKYAVSPEVEVQMELWLQRYPKRRKIVEIIRDLSVMVQWFEVEAAFDPYFYQPSNVSGRWIVPLAHRALDLIPEDIDAIAEDGFEMQEILRHAVTLFVQPIRRRFHIDTGPSEIRLRKLKGVLHRHLNNWAASETLLRWVIVAAGVEANKIEDQLWFAGVLATHRHFKHMQEDEHLMALQSFIWMDDVFEERMARFMSQVADIRDSAPIWPICCRRTFAEPRPVVVRSAKG